MNVLEGVPAAAHCALVQDSLFELLAVDGAEFVHEVLSVAADELRHAAPVALRVEAIHRDEAV